LVRGQTTAEKLAVRSQENATNCSYGLVAETHQSESEFYSSLSLVVTSHTNRNPRSPFQSQPGALDCAGDFLQILAVDLDEFLVAASTAWFN
jgi:hypothetical protein